MNSPNDDSVVVEGVHAAGEADVDAAVAAAGKAYKQWRKTSSAEKAKYMLKMAELVERDAEKLAKFETMCMGQPISVARKFVGSTPAYWRCAFLYLSKCSLILSLRLTGSNFLD